MEKYEKYYLEIVKTINDQIIKKWPQRYPYLEGVRGEKTNTQNIFDWAKQTNPDLYAKEKSLEAEINQLWDEDFEVFKTKIIAWGRVILQIYKKFMEL